MKHANLTHWAERVDLAAAFRWTVRENMHEAVSNHFSLAVNPEGSKFLINPNGRHFARITASSLLELDANDPSTMDRPDAPDPTAWGLHGSIHRALPHARCLMHVHSVHATVLASLADSSLPPIDQNSAMFFNRYVVDDHYGGMAFADEGARCAEMLADPKLHTLIMGNHGVLIIGRTVAETFNRLYYFEKAAATYILALQTGKPLRVLSDEVAEKTAQEWESYPGVGDHFLREIRALLDEQSPDYAS
ncbi:class II aldolase and adducin N-terminal domain-containing protein [Xinfangfangia sp. CPCC 101601]|uniref:Class II aldolase and adducin N-terminal domain-containing protein n=1 Tax=Pseudogemmobacter lacusdianii TaxID=3069608 RepID=A0ABU0W1N3_9RHOB|nr:class II aldolase and adducin N-terminal domain-containing protein [Xinfangfangia sp. CPCC 101601]MDQ2067330.1 class II aldolase and adducin N-terminal domain-containing protein [Xinfangfangia sp. CPCC 101601]